jgi:hypothetical protein
MKRILLAVTALSTLSFGSATIASGTSQSISFNSEPEGVSVLLDGQMKCKTPCTVSVKKNAFSNITFKKEGYQSQNVPLTTSMDGVGILNIFWDLSTTDAITGALWEYAPNSYMVEMKKK